MGQGANSLFETGIPNLDLLLGGGIPRRQTLIVTGSPGGGKTILVNQIAFLAASRGLPVVFATLTSEPHDKLIEQLSGFKFFRRDQEERQGGARSAPRRRPGAGRRAPRHRRPALDARSLAGRSPATRVLL